MDSNGLNNPYHNGAAGVPEEASDAQEKECLEIEEDENNESTGEVRDSDRKGRSKRLVGGILILLALAVTGTSLWAISSGRKTKIQIPVHDNTGRADSAAARGNDDPNNVTAQAIESVRNAIATPTPVIPGPAPAASGPSISPVVVGGTTVTPSTPVTVIDGVGSPISSPTTQMVAGQGGAPSSTAGTARRGDISSRRNPEQSIRCAPTPAPIRGGTVAQPLPEPAIPKRSLDSGTTLPPFGAMLPVRTLGAIFTLRQSLARFELTRDVRGQGWVMKKGTVLVGQLQGSEQDRAYVNLTGFIDPASGRLVELTGDLLGADGAPGLKGKRHKVSATWKRILDRAVTSGVALGQAALSRGNSTTIVLPGTVAPELTSLTSTSRREFVEVSAASPAYILITRLPEQAPGIDSPQVVVGTEGNSSSPPNDDGARTLSDEEVARLVESGSPEAIRAAMPRMSPELRRLAEGVLKEADR